MSDAGASFEPHRRYLIGIAYRMLGSVAEAQDVVQDAFLRWDATARSSVQEPRAFLARVVSRLCIDRMKSARAQREHYVGTWLPEPLVDSDPPHDPTELAEDLSIALLMTLERLSPLERAAFLLHDVFDMDYTAIADILDRSESAVRQLATRGRDHVRDERPRFSVSDEATTRLATAFHAAIQAGDLPALARLLADDAVFYSDGGGKRSAARKPIHGKDKILRLLTGLLAKGLLLRPKAMIPTTINGLPGLIVHTDEGVQTLTIEISGEQIVAIYSVRNPDKLRHLPQ